MSRIESASAVSQQLGAGSSVRGSWPDTQSQTSTGSVVRVGWVNGGVVSVSGVAISGGLYAGRPKTLLASTAVPANALVGTPAAITFGRERPAGLIQTDLECYAFRATLAWPAALGGALATNRDCGVILGKGVRLTTGVTGGVNYSGGGGVSFGPSGANTVRWMMRDNTGVITVNVDVTPAGFDYTGWHTWEIRMIGGTPSADPYVQGFLDGTPVTQKYSATVASGLFCNPYDAVGNVNAYFMAAANLTSGDVPSLYLHRCTMIAGRTETDLY